KRSASACIWGEASPESAAETHPDDTRAQLRSNAMRSATASARRYAACKSAKCASRQISDSANAHSPLYFDVGGDAPQRGTRRCANAALPFDNTEVAGVWPSRCSDYYRFSSHD